MVDLARNAEGLGQVGGSQEEHVDAVDGQVVLDGVDRLHGFDVDDHHEFGRFAISVYSPSGPDMPQSEALVPASPRNPRGAVLDSSNRGVGISGRVDPGDVDALDARYRGTSDRMCCWLVGTRAIGVTFLASAARQRSSTSAYLQRPVLTVEDQEVPALQGNEFGEARLGVAQESSRPPFPRL